MFFRRFYLPSLGHASYLVGSERTGEALLLDPRRDIDVYLEAVRREGLRLRWALDTHGHNDYLSGLSEVAARVPGVEILASVAGTYGYPHRPLRDGEQLQMGEVAFEVLHTPGHTPEHISLLVYEGSEVPAILLSGGALLVGDLARPDLLGGPEETRAAAREFCRTSQEKILPLPDHVEVFPTHVAGSLCGGNIGSRLSTTVGYERRTNAILAEVSSEEEFVEECLHLDDLPAVPPYWQRMRRRNLEGPPVLGTLPEPPALDPGDFEARMRAGAVVLDVRDPEAFGGGHIPGALNAGLGSSFPTWAGTVLPPEPPLLLVLQRPDDLWTVTWELLRIGYDPPTGWLAGGMRAWRLSGREIGRLEQITVHELHDRLGELSVLDVRQPAEWKAGHIPGATFITGAELPSRIEEAPRGPVAVICGSGYRSSAAASLLLHHGCSEVVNVLGGMSAWKAAGYPTVEGKE